MIGRGGTVAVLALAAACGGDGRVGGGSAGAVLLEAVPPTYLESELERVTADVRAAAETEGVEGDTGGLAATTARLESLTGVYLPLYRARVESANAYRHHARGETAEAEQALGRVEEILLGVSRGSPDVLEREMETTAGQAARARIAVASGSREAEPNLRRLVETLTDLLERAGLIL